MKNRKKLLLLLVITLLLGVTSACSKEVEEDSIEVYSYDEITEKEVILENDNLELHFFPETTQFYIVKKSTGYIWRSNPENTSDQGGFRKELESTITLRYNTESGSKTLLNNYGLSIEKGNYSYEIIDNSIKVNYTVGNVNKVYYIPKAVPESRFLEFYDKMSKSAQNQISMSYRIYDLNKLRKTDDRDALIAAYPDLEVEPVYVMMDGTPDYLIAMAEEKFAEVGYTVEDYEIDAARYGSSSTKDIPVFNVSIIYELTDEGFEVQIPLQDIEYKNKYPIVEIRPLPYFGAGGKTDDGFIFVPDGSGAIINFNNQKQSQNNFKSDLYGWDYALNRDAVIDENRSNMPIFGLSNNGSSFICILEEGNSYSFVEASVSGSSHDYNYVAANYNLIHSELMDITAKSDRTVRMFEQNLPDEVLKQRYILLDDDDYVSMATVYREYLMDRFPMLTKKTESDLPVAVEIIGAIDRTKHYMGIPVRRPYELTSYEEALGIIKELKEVGFTDLSINYNGWFNGGILHKAPNKVKLVSELGSKKDFRNLVNYTNENDVNLFLATSIQFVYNNSSTDNFIAIRDAAKYVNRKLIELAPYNPVFFGLMDSVYTYHLANPSYYMENFNKYANGIAKYDANGIAFNDIGMVLSADYNRKNRVSREEIKNMQMEKLEGLSSNGYNLMVRSGNMYAVPYADFIIDVNLATKGYNIIDEEIPFYQIALHGLVSYAGTPINLAPNRETSLLKTVETGAGLQFSFMEADIFDLQDSRYTQYYSSDFSALKDETRDLYNKMKSDFGHLYNQFITDHQKLANGVYMTEYEDGTQVIVNYNERAYTHKGNEVPAKDYIVEGGKQ
ncbi:MAG: hypothetical protein GX129_02970 [Clostridiales bacterium]|jgi:hypothetical protein|nr:hypothetical protein [Clostridiales bacterium]